MKTTMKYAGVAVCLCVAFGLTSRAEDGSSTNAPADHRGGSGMHRGSGGEKMKERVEQSDKLTAEQKKEILALLEKMKAEREKILNDSSLNKEQKRDAVSKLREKERDELKKYREALEGQQSNKQARQKT